MLDVVECSRVFFVPDPQLVLEHLPLLPLRPKVDLLVRGSMIERVLAVGMRLASSNSHQSHLCVRLLRPDILVLDTYGRSSQLGPALEGSSRHFSWGRLSCRPGSPHGWGSRRGTANCSARSARSAAAGSRVRFRRESARYGGAVGAQRKAPGMLFAEEPWSRPPAMASASGESCRQRDRYVRVASPAALPKVWSPAV